MAKDTTRLSTGRDNFNGPQERAGGDHLVEAIEEGILTPEGSLALDGGHLAGNKDQLHAGSKTHGHASPVPGAKGLASKGEGEGVTPQSPQGEEDFDVTGTDSGSKSEPEPALDAGV